MEVQEAVGAAIANEDKIIYKDSTYELVSKVALSDRRSSAHI